MNGEYYYNLEDRAASKGITTFGDIVSAMGVDVSDIWPYDEPDDLNDRLYWCDGATGALEVLAQEGLI